MLSRCSAANGRSVDDVWALRLANARLVELHTYARYVSMGAFVCQLQCVNVMSSKRFRGCLAAMHVIKNSNRETNNPLEDRVIDDEQTTPHG